MLKDALKYDPNTGLFTWTVTTGRARVGAVAGNADNKGYIIIEFRGVQYKAHRLAWFFMTGDWPNGEIDHRDQDKSNNRWGNLRLATDAQNKINSDHRRSHDLPRGVHRDRGRFKAQIRIDGKAVHLGCFGSPEEAHAAYMHAAQVAFGQFLPKARKG